MNDARASQTPPRLALWLLRRTCPLRLAEAVEGDLTEGYHQRIERKGRVRAALWFWREAVLFSLWHGWVHESTYLQAWGPIMFKSYLTVALRNLRRQFGYAAINIVGLAVGLACFLLVVLYLQHETSFDAYHEKGDRLYRIVSYRGFAEKRWSGGTAGDPTDLMRDSFTDVEDATRLDLRCGPDHLLIGGDVIQDLQPACGESNLFNLFSFDLRQGDPATVLDRPNTVVITRSLALRIFGDENPIGQALPLRFYDEDRSFEITGVMDDVPANTHFTFDLLLSYESLRTTDICLDCGGVSYYALLKEGANPGSIAERVLAYVRDTEGKEYVEDIRLEPLHEIHFSDIYAARQGDQRYVYLLSAIALVILLIACANYMNLATARSIRRTREVGVRKVVGAHRGQLVRQFMMETLLLTLLALPLALLLLYVALPTFNTLAESNVMLAWRENLAFGGAIVGVMMLVGILAGSYPALFLSRFQPVDVLRGRLPSRFSGTALRKVLVVFQFMASIILLIGTLVILRQLDFMQQQKLGFDAEQVVLVQVADPVLAQQPEALKQEFLRHANVLSATAGFGLPGQQRFHATATVSRPYGEDGPAVTLNTPAIDEDFLETMKIPLLTGRNIEPYRPDSTRKQLEILVNETAVEAMPWTSPEDALGKEIYMGIVVGVVEDFHFESLHQEVAPLLMRQNEWGQAGVIALRLAGGDIPATLAELEETWEATGTAMPFDYSFLRDEINQLYEQEQRTATVFGLFAGLAILIAALGLLGLAAFAVAQRTKEIGIRKVLGATVTHLVGLLTTDFLKLVAVAFVVAVPVAYLAAERWLEAFAYRIDLAAGPFVLAGGLALVIAVGTISIQAVRAALANPVEALRQE